MFSDKKGLEKIDQNSLLPLECKYNYSIMRKKLKLNSNIRRLQQYEDHIKRLKGYIQDNDEIDRAIWTNSTYKSAENLFREELRESEELTKLLIEKLEKFNNNNVTISNLLGFYFIQIN